jgi:uncharacterized phiE125 gp8 family phage protein
MAVVVTIPPTAEPLTLAEVKMHLRLEYGEDDADVLRMIRVARQMAEGRTGRALMPQTLTFAADEFCGTIKVPRPPLRNLDSIKYVDANGATQTLDPAAYRLDGFQDPPRISAAYGAPWPATRDQTSAVQVQYQAGYADAASVPEPIRQWMLLAIGAMYENRESLSAGVQVYALPEQFMYDLLQPYMVYQ